MNRIRILLGAFGLGLGGYGAWLVLDLGLANLLDSVPWLVGGVVVHDGVIGPAVIVAAVLGTRVVRGPLPAPVIAGAVVLGSVTLAVIPMLGRFGALEDNPTLVPRDYLVGWLVFAGVVAGLVTAALLVRRRSAKGRAQAAVPPR